jgi:hypothetical protein
VLELLRLPLRDGGLLLDGWKLSKDPIFDTGYRDPRSSHTLPADSEAFPPKCDPWKRSKYVKGDKGDP